MTLFCILRDKLHQVLNPESTDITKIRMIQINKIVYNEEDVHSKLLSVFSTLHEVADTVFLLLVGTSEKTDIYVGLRSSESASMAEIALKNSMEGNFPGTDLNSLSSIICNSTLKNLVQIGEEKNTAVVSVTQIPAQREDLSSKGFDSQNIEHFIESMMGKPYVAMIIANPLSPKVAKSQRNNLENLYSSLSVLSELSYQYSENTSVSEQHNLTMSVTNSITDSLTIGYSFSTMQSSGTNQGSSPSIHTQFNSLGLGYGLHSGTFQSTGVQQGTTTQQSQAIQKGTQKGIGVGTGKIQGNTKGITLKQENKTVSEMLFRIDEQIKRLHECETYGIWECCAFFASPATDIALVAANVYRSLFCGSKTGNETSYINIWDYRKSGAVNSILRSLQNARMPVFKFKNHFSCNPGALISGNELPIVMNFPLHSVNGLTVVKMAPFGRAVFDNSQDSVPKKMLKIGNVQHMGHTELTPVKLDINSFSAHTLVTGTTGVGKSTAMAMILSALHDINIKLLIVEPVKGEYKDLLGGIPNIQVFTTNPLKNRMLHINPFQFREGIHVLSHIDRLIEVFSVCWPLYAAQPAMLRECIEESYIRVGWDLNNSVYVGTQPTKYPDFRVLLEVIPEIIKKSKFVGESKGTYEGALLTRVAMLTKGIYGQVFNSNSYLNDECIFDKNTIIDLSEVGSQETISLLMGILVVRLREYRTSSSRPQNQPLHHVMVLEEAHNIFQRKSQSSVEGGETVSGKSVQMLSQCIAEMRGYGQGFFIVDQSPNEIDISGIRNTATKIIMRLPEAADQKTVAQSLSLNENQIAELSRLPRQTAIIYQTGWTEPVMVRINDSKNKYYKINNDIIQYNDLKKIRGFLLSIVLSNLEKKTFEYDKLVLAVNRIQGISEDKKQDFINCFNAFNDEYICKKNIFFKARIHMPFFSELITELLASSDFCKLCKLPVAKAGTEKPYSKNPKYKKQCEKWKVTALSMLDNYVCGLDNESKDALLELIILYDNKSPVQTTVHNVLYGLI